MRLYRIALLFLAATILSLTFLHLASAQTLPPAQKFDEFGDILFSDLMARLDNYAVQLQQQPNTKGFIIVYRTRRDLPGLSHSLALRMKGYLVGSRGLSKDRIVTVDGGVAECLTQELWIVLPGSAPPPRGDARVGSFQYRDSAWKFDEYHFLPREQNARFGLPKGTDSDFEYLEAYANEVKRNRAYLACIIAYAQYNRRPGLVDYADHDPRPDVRLDLAGTARRMLDAEKSALMKVYGIAAARIRTIDGGYRKRREVELWIVPPGEPLPIPTPNAFPRGRKRT